MKTREERRSVNAGGEFAIRLVVAPDLAWQLMDCPAGLERIGTGYEPVPETGLPVTSRTQVFRFLAVFPGRYSLVFALKRDNDTDTIEQRRIRVSVR